MNKLFLLSIVLPEPALLTHISALPSIPCFDFCAVVLPPRMNFLFEPIRESFCESSLSVCLPAFLPISRVDIAQHTSVCTHNCISYSNTPNTGCPVLGVHINIDAPFHFIKDGKTVDSIDLATFVGMAYVAEYHGIVSDSAAAEILEKARKQNTEAAKRILIKGEAEISAQAAKVFADSGILLLGNESQTVGPEAAPMEVHLILLRADVVLLEGIRLAEVSEGAYFLNAAPLNLSGADGSPCRAVLIADER